MCAQADNIDQLFLVQRNSNGIKEGTWEQLQMDLIIPTIAADKDIKVYVMNAGSSLPIYFDDLCISYVGVINDSSGIIKSSFKDERDRKIYVLIFKVNLLAIETKKKMKLSMADYTHGKQH